MMAKKNYRNQRISRSRQSVFPWRSFLFYFFILSFSVFLIAGGFFGWRWMQKPTAFPIKQVIIQGQLTHVTANTIQHIMQTQLSGGFFSLDVSAAKQAILAMPWVKDVSFRRIWPDKLVVRMKEQEAVARFGKEGLLNADGIVFYPDMKTIPQNLPDLIGPSDEAQSLFTFYQTANALVKLLGLQIVSLHVNAEQSWDLMLNNQVRITVGRHNAMARVKRFVTIYPKIIALSQRPMLSVDLRYPNGVAVEYTAAK